jgi:parvulin-like peptidyl-prolyl isomerase
MVGYLARIAVAGSVALVAACGPADDVIATVGDERASLDSLKRYITEVTGEPWQGVADPVASRLLDQYLDQEVLVAAASREHSSDLPSAAAARSVRVRDLIDDLCGSAPPPDDADVERELEAAVAEVRPARARVRQMLLDSLDEAEAARRQLDEGADFVELSRQVSRAPNAGDGGELGMLTEGGLSDELDTVIFALEAGEISDPVKGPSGYHIFQVLEVVPAGPSPRSELEPEVRRRLAETAARRHARQCVRQLALEVGVDVVRERLWFDYRGRYAE